MNIFLGFDASKNTRVVSKLSKNHFARDFSIGLPVVSALISFCLLWHKIPSVKIIIIQLSTLLYFPVEIFMSFILSWNFHWKMFTRGFIRFYPLCTRSESNKSSTYMEIDLRWNTSIIKYLLIFKSKSYVIYLVKIYERFEAEI